MLKGEQKHSLKRKTKQQNQIPDSYITQILELSSKKFKIAMINMLRTLVGKNRQQQEQMGDLSIDENSKKESKGNVKLKNTDLEGKNTF